MTVADKDYEICKWVVENNARGQAKSDADTMRRDTAVEYINDPILRFSAQQTIERWIDFSDKSELLLVGINERLMANLSGYQKDELKKYWTTLYMAIVSDLLRERFA